DPLCLEAWPRVRSIGVKQAYRAALFSALGIGLAVASLAAQTRASAIEGTVRDTTGAAVPQAGIGAHGVEAERGRRVTDDAGGPFRFPDLPPGSYVLTVEKTGFAPYRHEAITIALGQTGTVAIELQAAGVTQSVVVTAQPPPIDVAQTSTTTSI